MRNVCWIYNSIALGTKNEVNKRIVPIDLTVIRDIVNNGLIFALSSFSASIRIGSDGLELAVSL
jgi:hypothetical protein